MKRLGRTSVCQLLWLLGDENIRAETMVEAGHRRMISRRGAVLGLLALAVAARVRPLTAATRGVASRFIGDLGDQALGALRADGDSLDRREARFRDLLREGFDLPFIARFTLGKTWRRATPNQQSEFVEAFAAYVLRTYAMRFGGYAGETMTIVSERAAGDKDIVVQTRIDRPRGAPVDARWRVRTTGARLRIIDVMVEGISMAVTQRDEFASVIRGHGLDGLIEILRARTNKMTAVAQ